MCVEHVVICCSENSDFIALVRNGRNVKNVIILNPNDAFVCI